MPSVKKGEKQSHYMSRCVPEVKGEGKSHKATVGKCMGMFKNKWKGGKKK